MENEQGHQIGTPGHSPALRFELMLKESFAGSSGPSQERIQLCFTVLDEVLPYLGVFQRVAKMLRDELHSAVFSTEYTSGSSSHAKTKKHRSSAAKAIQPLPYFTIAKRYIEKRNEDLSKLKQEISSLKEQLYTCDADLERANSAVEAYRHDVKDRDAKLHKQASELRARTAEKERLQKIVNQHQRAQDRLRQEVEFRMYSLKNTIGSLKEDNHMLRKYKNTHDDIQESLARPKAFHSLANEKSKTPALPSAQLQQHMQTSQQFTRQLLLMQNTLLDEYDGWLDTIVTEEQVSVSSAIVKHQQESFRQNIAAVTNELALTQSHTETLTERHADITALLAQHPQEHKALVLPSHPANPLLPQEQPTSRYSAMLYSSSDGGCGYYPLKEAQDCLSCGEKTVLCPHKAFTSEMVVQLPVGSTHIKISRPRLVVGGAKGDGATAGKRDDKKTTKPEAKTSTRPPQPMQPDFAKIWGSVSARYPAVSDRDSTRTLTAEQVLCVCHQFWASVILHDDRASLSGSDEEQGTTLLESLYGFMAGRYTVEAVVPLATQDFLHSLQQQHTQHKELLVLSLVLCGHLDGAAGRYLLLLATLVDRMPWNSIKEFTPWAELVYPTMQEEDLEQLTMNFIAHSGNRVSKHLIIEYLTLLALRHREPHITELDARLQEAPSRKTGAMLEVEFAEAMENIVPFVSDQLCRRLFLQSLAQLQEVGGGSSKRESLPIKRLAHIAGYLSLQARFSQLVKQVEQLAHSSTAVVQPVTPPTRSGTTPTRPVATPLTAQPPLYTMETVREMAVKMKALLHM